jgi:hypothetical protein
MVQGVAVIACRDRHRGFWIHAGVERLVESKWLAALPESSMQVMMQRTRLAVG